MAKNQGRSPDINPSAIPLADGRSENGTAKSQQSCDRAERNIMLETPENTGFFRYFVL